MADQDALDFLQQFGSQTDPKALANAYFAPKPLGPGIPIIPPQSPPPPAQLPIGLPAGMTLGLPPGAPPMAHVPASVPGMAPDPTRAAFGDIPYASKPPPDAVAAGGSLTVPDVTIQGGRVQPQGPSPQDYARQGLAQGGGGGLPPALSGWVGKERVLDQGPDVSKELADIDKAQKTVEEGVEESRQAGEQGKERRAKVELGQIGSELNEAEQKLGEARRMSAAGQLDPEHALRAKQAELEQASNDLANRKVDPGRYFHNANMFSKLASIAGVLVGGFNQGFMAARGVKVGNPAMEMLNDAIDRDMAAQREDLSTEKASLGARGDAMSKLMAQFKDQNEREMAARLMKRQAAQDQLKTIAEGVKDAQAQGQLKVFLGQNQLEIAKEKARLDAAMQGTVKEEQVNADLLKRGGGGGPGKVNKMDEEWIEKNADLIAKESAAEEAYGNGIRALSSPGAAHALGPAADAVYAQSPYLYAKIYGDDAAKIQQASRLAMHQYTHELGGARGFSPAEIQQFQATIDAQHTPEGKIAALKMVREQIGSRRRQIQSGGTDTAVQELKRREEREGAGPNAGPAPATTPGSFR